MSRRLICRVGRIKIYRDAEWSEFQVVDPDNANATYHTDDRGDAYCTAKTMDDFPVGSKLDAVPA